MTGKPTLSEGKVETALTGKEVAVIGMAGQFPGSKTIHEFWRNLKNGIESIAFFTDEELESAGVDPQTISNPDYVKAKGFIESKGHFDAGFFGYTPLEARVMNPQVRMLHECAWEALENAAYDPGRYDGLIGLYAGAGSSTHWEILMQLSGGSAEIGGYAASYLNDKDYINARVSYNLNLNGPVFFIHTACSTSLVAIHVACRALLTGECNMALAGGITISTSPDQGYLYETGMIMSPDGHCRAFDANAGGTVGGDGGGLVLLKRLKDALAEGDHIYAIIKGSAINNDGNRKIGFTAPSLQSQAEVIRTAQRIARVEPETISYIEAHGTGTTLGDPVELKALTLAFNTSKRHFCAIGSVKTNIGHLDTGAGVAGFIKTVLALNHCLIPPSLHYQSPNPGLDIENSPFYINRRLKTWKRNGSPLRAGINSLGIGGTNAHVILEEWPARSIPAATGQESWHGKNHQLLLLSARTEKALDKMTRNLGQHFKENHHINLADAAYTLQTGRRVFDHRRMAVCSTLEEAGELLSSPQPGNGLLGTAGTDYKRVVFMFPGQGAQYINMGLDLYREEPVFREEMDRCFEILRGLTNEPVKEILYPPPGTGADPEKINRTEITQPVIFIFEYALAKLLMRWGIRPHAMVGHSIGEYVAACLAGVFSLEDALKLVVLRGRLIQQLPPGAMLSLRLSKRELAPILQHIPTLSLAAVNSPVHCVVSGTFQDIEACVNLLDEAGHEYQRLHTSHAFHSSMMDPVLESFREAVMDIRPGTPGIQYPSNVTGDWITEDNTASPVYWTEHIRRTVRFSDGLEKILSGDEAVLFLETGPGKALSTFVQQQPTPEDRRPPFHAIHLVRHPKVTEPDDYHLLTKIGQLWLYGQSVDWSTFHQKNKRHRLPLPTYPFERRHYSAGDQLNKFYDGMLRDTGLAGKRPEPAGWFYIPVWERSLPGVSTSRAEEDGSPRLVFSDEYGFASRFLERLADENYPVIKVMTGTSFEEEGGGIYTINPGHADDYGRLFSRLRELDMIPRRILHFWGVTPLHQSPGFKNIDRFQQLGLYSLLDIVQAMGRNNFGSETRIEVVTSHMQEVVGGDGMFPVKATVLGAVRVIPVEYPNITCRSIDIDLPAPGSPRENTLMSLLAEEFSDTTDSTEHFIAYRANHRWIRTIKPHPFQQPPSTQERLKAKGVYLIIGGFGGMGFTLAQFLAEKVNARLGLVGRSTFPAEADWDAWESSHDRQDETSTKIRTLRELKKQGAEVMLFNTDVSNFEQMKEVIDGMKERFGKINGVIHAAGVIDYGGVIQRRTREITRECMAPKVNGTLVLEELLKNEPLDFLCLFSSIGNILYGHKFGQVAYNASNEFLDAMSYYKNSQDNIFAATINWCDWEEVGMTIRAHKKKLGTGADHQEFDIEDAITPNEGTDVFSRVLSNRLPHIVIFPGDLLAKMEQVNHTKLEDVGDADTIEEPGSPALIQRPGLSTSYVAPGNENEKIFAEIFQKFFGIEKIGIYDDFFELGGDSLRALTLVAKIHKELNVNLTLAEFFERPTIQKLARFFEITEKSDYSSVEPAEKKEYYPLSSAQMRLYVLQQMRPESTVYNSFEIFKSSEEPDTKKLEDIFKKLIQRHEILRTSFQWVDGTAVQKIHPDARLDIEHFDIDYDSRSEDNIYDGIIKDFIRPFDLSKAPILRVGVVRTHNRSYALMVDLHHIISDGFSRTVLINDFMAIYSGRETPALRIQYKDYVEWQTQDRQKKSLESQKEYWLKEFAGDIPELILPADYSRPEEQSFSGHTIHFDFGKEETGELNRLAQKEEVTLFMLLLALYNLLLSKISGQEDIVVGTGVDGRNHVDLQPIMGMFINTIALRNQPEGKKTFREFLKEVKTKTLKVFENQDYQFEDLVDEVTSSVRDTSRNPLFNVMFQFQNYAEPDEIAPDFVLKSYVHTNMTSKFDLTLFAQELKEEGILNFSLEYSTELFKIETIQWFILLFREITASIINDPGIQLFNVAGISQTEKVAKLYSLEDDLENE